MDMKIDALNFTNNLNEEELAAEYTAALIELEGWKKYLITLKEAVIRRIDAKKHVPGYRLKTRHKARVVRDMAKLYQFCNKLGVTTPAFIDCCTASLPKLETLIDGGSLNQQLLKQEIIYPITMTTFIKKEN